MQLRPDPAGSLRTSLGEGNDQSGVLGGIPSPITSSRPKPFEPGGRSEPEQMRRGRRTRRPYGPVDTASRGVASLPASALSEQARASSGWPPAASLALPLRANTRSGWCRPVPGSRPTPPLRELYAKAEGVVGRPAGSGNFDHPGIVECLLRGVEIGIGAYRGQLRGADGVGVIRRGRVHRCPHRRDLAVRVRRPLARPGHVIHLLSFP